MGITLALFIVLQAGSGLLLSLSQVPAWHEPLGLIHYRAGVGGSVYRIFVGIGTLGMAVSGSIIFRKSRARPKKR